MSPNQQNQNQNQNQNNNQNADQDQNRANMPAGFDVGKPSTFTQNVEDQGADEDRDIEASSDEVDSDSDSVDSETDMTSRGLDQEHAEKERLGIAQKGSSTDKRDQTARRAS